MSKPMDEQIETILANLCNTHDFYNEYANDLKYLRKFDYFIGANKAIKEVVKQARIDELTMALELLEKGDIGVAHMILGTRLAQLREEQDNEC